MDFPRPFRGIIPPLATPLRDRNTLDVAGLERLVESVIGGGVHGIFLLGTTGEAPGLSYNLRREIIERVCGQCSDRLPVLVGVSDTSVVESLRLAEFAALHGACAVVATAPYYYPLSQSEMLGFLERTSEEFPLPLFLYELPSHVAFRFEPETVRRASEMPNICGLKDSSGDLDHFVAVHAAVTRKDFSILVGPEQLLAESVSRGAHGGVCGGANLYPELYVKLYEAAVAKNPDEIARLQEQVNKICEQVYQIRRGGSAYLRGLKFALACKGICDEFVAEPYSVLPDADRERIRLSLIELGILAQPVH